MVKKGECVGLYLSGQPVKIPECNIAITQPKIKDIVVFGEDEFLIAVNLLGHTENLLNQMRQGNPQLEVIGDFQLLMMVMNQELTIKDSIQKFLELIFPDYRVEISDAAINFYAIVEEQEHQVGRIFPFNFEVFQQTINDLFEPIGNNDEPDYNPANDTASKIAEKIKKGRERKRQQNLDKEGSQSLFGRYASVLSIGMQMSIATFFEYTPFQLYDAFNRYFLKVQSDLYMKVSTTPLMDTSKMEEPKDWVSNLYHR